MTTLADIEIEAAMARGAIFQFTVPAHSDGGS